MISDIHDFSPHKSPRGGDGHSGGIADRGHPRRDSSQGSWVLPLVWVGEEGDLTLRFRERGIH